MKSALIGLACALATLAGMSAFAGRPQTLNCNQTVTFGPLDCNGTASLVCGPNGALLSYNMTSCLCTTRTTTVTPLRSAKSLLFN